MYINFRFLRGIKNTLYLASGNFIVQIITLVGFIYIARMLGPEDYGIYVTVGAFVGLFNFFLLGGLNRSIIREGSKDLSHMHIALEKTIGLRNGLIVIAIVVCIISSFFTPYEFQVKLYILIFSLQLANTGVKGFVGTIYQTTEKMQYIPIFDIANRALFVLLSITFLYLGYGVLVLFIISLFANFSTLLISYRFSQRFVKFHFFSKIQFDKNLLKPALTFSLLSFIGFFVQRVDLLMISFLGTSKDVGLYGVAYQAAHYGVLLRNLTVTAFFPVFVKQFYKAKMKGSALIKYSLIFFIGIFLISLAVSFYVEDITVTLFGSNYQNSGGILRVLIFYIAFTWATLPFTTAAQATHNEKYLLIVTSIMALLNIPLNYILFLKYGVIGIAYSTLTVYSIGGILMVVITYSMMKKQGHLL